MMKFIKNKINNIMESEVSAGTLAAMVVGAVVVAGAATFALVSSFGLIGAGVAFGLGWAGLKASKGLGKACANDRKKAESDKPVSSVDVSAPALQVTSPAADFTNAVEPKDGQVVAKIESLSLKPAQPNI